MILDILCDIESYLIDCAKYWDAKSLFQEGVDFGWFGYALGDYE
jgi:hypothetical protein